MDEGARQRLADAMAGLSYCFAPGRRVPSSNDFAQLERRLRAPLPEPYRTFLGEYGSTFSAAGTIGFDVSDPAWAAGNGRHGLDAFLGFSNLEDVGIEHELTSFGERIGDGNLPIARTCNDDVAFLRIDGSRRGTVAFLDHDAARSPMDDDEGPWVECIYDVAVSFEAFLGTLSVELSTEHDTTLGLEAALARTRKLEARLASYRAEDLGIVRAIRTELAGFDRIPVSGPADDRLARFIAGAVRNPHSDATRRALFDWLALHGGHPVSPVRIRALMDRLYERFGPARNEASSTATPAVREEAVAEKPRFVDHPKFGRGEVLRVIDGSKYLVRFRGGIGDKTLLASRAKLSQRRE